MLSADDCSNSGARCSLSRRNMAAQVDEPLTPAAVHVRSPEVGFTVAVGNHVNLDVEHGVGGVAGDQSNDLRVALNPHVNAVPARPA